VKHICLLSILLFSSCSSSKNQVDAKEGRWFYSYIDVSGTYVSKRETKLLKKKLVTRVQMSDSKSQKVVEKSITVSQMGTIKEKKARVLTLRPYASEFSVWLEGKRYFSKMQLDPKSRSMVVKVEGPDPKWKGETVAFPKGKYFCFYSQIPDCLYHTGLLKRVQNNKQIMVPFYIVWDQWPFTQEMFSGLGRELFAKAELKFDGQVNQIIRYVVELDGQVILYHFSTNFELKKIAWIAQGITVVPPGEENFDEEQ
jgi:hypothetical protein